MGMFHDHDHGHGHSHGNGNGFRREDLRGMRVLRRLADITDRTQREEAERGIDLGLEAAPSRSGPDDLDLLPRPAARLRRHQHVPQGCRTARTSATSASTTSPSSARRSTWAPRTAPAAASGPQAVRRISALYDSYNADMGVDLAEELNLCDAGDIFVIPSNLEKSFDQIDRAVAFVHAQGTFPVVIGGDHSIGYPDVRAIAPHIDGQGRDHPPRPPHRHPGARHGRAHAHDAVVPRDQHPERAAERTWSRWASAGWYGSRPGMKVARERDTTVITISDVEELGVEQGGRDRARVRLEGRRGGLPVASTSTRSMPASSPGTGSPEPGGLLPREALQGAADDRARGALRDGGGRDRAALRRLRHHRAARLPRDHGRARHPGRGGPPRFTPA